MAAMPSSSKRSSPKSGRRPKRAPSKRKALASPRRASGRAPLRKASGGRRGTSWAAPEVLVNASTDADVVEIPARRALAIDGEGSPHDDAFGRALAALYGVSYTLRFARKKGGGTDFRVAPLEGRWWAEGWSDDAVQPPPALWRWRLRISVPPDVARPELDAAIALATGRKGGKLEGNPEAARVFLEELPPQRCGRVLHVGPYADEPRSFAAIARALEAAGLAPAPSHLEVYLSDPRRTAPARLRTVLLREVA